MSMTTTDGGDSMRRSSVRIANNPRRRHRVESNSPAQPRRKRSKLDKNTVDTAPTDTESIRSGLNALAVHSFSRADGGARPKRSNKADGSTVLAQNEHYSVRHLLSTPDVLRNSASDYRASLLSSPPYALAITRERAYIWDYTAPAPVSHPKTFDVTRPARSTDPLPLAALVTSQTKEIGLVVVSAVTGNVTYWPNIDTAESLSLFNQQNTGVQGSLGSLSSSETVIDLVSAEHAGFIVTLSSGRVAQMSLTDDQGKPSISAHFLRSTDAASSAGIFGSLKSALGVGPWKRDIVAVRTRPISTKREIQAIAGTESGHIYTWHLAWSGQPNFRGAFDCRQFLQTELAARLGGEPISLLDMVVTPASLHPDAPLQLLLLVRSGSAMVPSYALTQITMLNQDDARLDGIVSITVASTSSTIQRPRLLLPKPGHTAFVVFEKEVVVSSMTGPRPFQDAIRLRSERHLTIEGGCEEDLIDTKGTSSCAIFVKNYGLARISAVQTNAPHPSLKTKIEQAIFYGTMSDNILSFAKTSRDRYDQEETEEAALLISDEIMRSSSPFIPPLTSSMESHLQNRIKALRALILHLRSDYPPVSKLTSWKLLADAERLAAAQAIWAMFEDKTATANNVPKPTLLPNSINALVMQMQKSKSRDLSVDGANLDVNSDVIRSWFVKEVGSVDKLRNIILFAIVGRHEGGKGKNLLRLISEADDILFSMYDTVFKFRSENAEIYGLDSTLFNDGILEQDYEDLTEPWTSTYDMFNALNRFIDIARNHTVEFYENPKAQESDEALFVEKVVRENVHLVQILSLCYRERIGYVTAHYGSVGPSYAPGLKEAFNKARTHHLGDLAKIGQASAGIGIAEKYKDMDTLVKLVVNESEYLTEILSEPQVQPHERAAVQGRMDILQASVEGYFKTFCDDWANAFFDHHLVNHHSYGLLKEAEHFREPLTRYLRAEKARGRLAWINDVLHEGSFQDASKALTNLAQEQEIKFWNKKVELSLAKLSSLAAVEAQGNKALTAAGAEESKSIERRFNGDLTLAYIQDAIRDHLQYILYAAVDTEAEVQLASDAYAMYLKLKTPALHQLLEIALEDMLKNKALSVEQVIDILTLMDTVDSKDPEANIIGKQFLLAFQALEAAKPGMDEERFETNLRMIWKRCYLQDDWDYINNTNRKSDKLVSAHIRDTFACQTMLHGLENALFHAGSGIRMIAPSETLGAGCTTQDLQSRFPSDDIRDPIMHDNMVQDRQLQKMVEKNNVDHWHTVCLEEAKKKMEEAAEASLQDEQASQQLQQDMAEAEAEDVVEIAAVSEGNGDAEMTEQEDDGDVQMAAQ